MKPRIVIILACGLMMAALASVAKANHINYLVVIDDDVSFVPKTSVVDMHNLIKIPVAVMEETPSIGDAVCFGVFADRRYIGPSITKRLYLVNCQLKQC